MRMPGPPAMGGDRLRPGRQQRRDLPELADQGAGRDLQPLGGQRRHDPVHRPAQHVLLVQQPGQEPGAEQPLRDHLGRRRRAGRPRPVARAAAPVAAAAQQDPDQRDPPVDQLAVLGADELVPGPAAQAAPLLRFQVDDAFLGLQVRITAAAVPRRARTLPPFARTMPPSARAVLAGAAAARGRSALFAGGAEQQPAQRRDRFLQLAHLGGQHGHPGVQLRVLLPQPRGLRLSQPGPGTPAREVSAVVDRLRGGHASPPHITTGRLSRTKPGVSQIPGSARTPQGPQHVCHQRVRPTLPLRVHRLLTLPRSYRPIFLRIEFSIILLDRS